MPARLRTLLALACGGCLFAGCSQPENAAEATPLPPVELELALPSLEPELVPAPLDAVPAADLGADPEIVAAMAPDMLGYFQDDRGRVVPQNTLQLLEQAADLYLGLQYTFDDPWPDLTDLQLLVKCGLLRSIPPAPAGQKFVVDPKTGRISVAGQ